MALTAVGLGSIIGSGWLFGAERAAALAGPAAILAWVIGAAVALTIALTYSELGSMFPKAGAWSGTASTRTARWPDIWPPGPTGSPSSP
ncbi:hypothetical protein SVIO_069060 [Streptomyces violaceusniger]|uniref:Amino acid permease/ SLC12A domain-containing protein n=1 Tax=Streptomyces violaceusniger TaxID=68280 RepID=A0A4D4LDW4_STRVO|nr:hypothetical protein SVIO_069060 [Streptomyces violaceusniger]